MSPFMLYRIKLQISIIFFIKKKEFSFVCRIMYYIWNVLTDFSRYIQDNFLKIIFCINIKHLS